MKVNLLRITSYITMFQSGACLMAIAAAYVNYYGIFPDLGKPNFKWFINFIFWSFASTIMIVALYKENVRKLDEQSSQQE